jgi:hypothetical protein
VSPLASFNSISYPFPNTGIPLGILIVRIGMQLWLAISHDGNWNTRKNWNIDLNKSRIVLKRKCGLGAPNGCTSYHCIHRKVKTTLSMQSNTAI